MLCKTIAASATLVPLDVIDFKALGGSMERYGRLNIPVGNAAPVGPSSPLDNLTVKD